MTTAVVPALTDVSHPPAVAPATVPPAPVAPAAVAPTPVAPAAVAPAPVAPAPVTDSDPAPVPDPVAPMRTPLTTAVAPAQAPSSPAAGIAPAGPPPVAAQAPAAPAPAPAAAPPPAPAPVVPPVAVPEVHTTGTVAAAVAPAPVPAPAPEPDSAAEAPAPKINASASVIDYALKNGVDLTTVTGTGHRGKIIKKDVVAVVSARQALNGQDQSVTQPAQDQSADAQPAPPADTAVEQTGAPMVAAPHPVPASEAPPVAPPVTPATDTPAPAAPITTLATTAAAAAPAADAQESTCEIAVKINVNDGRRFVIHTTSDLVDLASQLLPGLTVLGASLEMTATGIQMLVTVSSLAAVEL